MTRSRAARARDHAMLLAISISGVVLAVLSLREAAPSDLGVRMATAASLTLGLTTAFALWLGARCRAAAEGLHGEWDGARALLAAIPDALLVVHDGDIRSVNRRLCELVGFDEVELLGCVTPYPFWPPEHRHEIEAWHAELEAYGEADGELTFRRRDGGRIRVIASGRTVSDEAGRSQRLVSVRDISAGHRRELRLAELASRDSETGLLNRGEFEERLGDAVRRALASGSNVSVVLAELTAGGRTGEGVFRRPDALVAVERLRALLRVDDEIARTGEGELGWILHDTDAHGGVGAVARARTDLAALEGIALTVGICDLAAAGNALALYAYADRALAAARGQGIGGTAQHTARAEAPAWTRSVQPAPARVRL
jgi:PAS domain S-box-containing protein